MGNLANIAPNQNNNEAKSENWKAEAFINISVMDDNGNRLKVGGLPLKGGTATHASILEVLRNDPDAIERLRDKLVLDFQEVNKEAPKISF